MDGHRQGSYSLMWHTDSERNEEMRAEEAGVVDRGGQLRQVQMGQWDHGEHAIRRLLRRRFAINARTSSKPFVDRPTDLIRGHSQGRRDGWRRAFLRALRSV